MKVQQQVDDTSSSSSRRRSLSSAMLASAGGGSSGGVSSFLTNLFGGVANNKANAAAAAVTPSINNTNKEGRLRRPTNEIIKSINGMRQRRLGSSDILVSELGLGTQRWVSADFNSPTKEEIYQFMDKAILNCGVNLIDTAEQYPIPSDSKKGVMEGDTECQIGEWMASRKVNKGEARNKVVIATKITGGRNITPSNVRKDCDGSLSRLQLDYIDI